MRELIQNCAFSKTVNKTTITSPFVTFEQKDYHQSFRHFQTIAQEAYMSDMDG